MSYSETIIYTPSTGATGGGPPASTQWRQPVADLTALGAITGDPEGSARYVDDEDAIYVYVLPQQVASSPDIIDGEVGSWIRISGSAASLFKVQATAPTAPVDGCLWANTTDDGLYKYDSGRAKWLSTDAVVVQGTANQVGPTPAISQVFFIRSTSTQDFLMDGTGAGDKNGFAAPFNMTLVSLNASSDDGVNVTWNVTIYDGQTGLKTVTFNIVGADSFYDSAADLDFATGDRIVIEGQATPGGGTVTKPIIYAGFRRRA